MSEVLWIVGGEQRGVPHWTREWRLYKKALVVKAEAGDLERVLEYESPPEHCPEVPSIVFKAASITQDRAYLCTQTEILICDFPSFAIRDIISLPCFNDVHHVAVTPDGRLFVVITGLDAVAELTPDGKLLRLVSVIGGSVWDRFSPQIDYRKVATTKPHRAHPNFVFFIHDVPWVTRFEQRDAVPLDANTDGRSVFSLGDDPVHDGYVDGDYIYFTTVDGRILRFNVTSGTQECFDMNLMGTSYPGGTLGWCRGVLPHADCVWVGFSRIRYTNLRQNVDWVRRGFRRVDRHPPAPTRIARYNFRERKLLEEIDLEPLGMNTIFSIHAPQRSPLRTSIQTVAVQSDAS